MKGKSLKQKFKEAKSYIEQEKKEIENADKELDALKQSINDRKLVIFVGSAISSFIPSCFPKGEDFTKELIHIFKKTCPILKINEKNLDELLYSVPFEVFLFFGEEATNANKILSILNRLYTGNSWNWVHKALSELLKKNCIIITSNYDILIESTFLNDKDKKDKLDEVLSENGVLRILKNGGKNITDATINNSSSVLFKIHGSIDFPESIVYQINQEGLLEPWRKLILQKLITSRDILFLGYSGRDFDILPELLRYSNYIRKIYWNILDGNIYKNISADACLLIHQAQGKPLIGDMRILLQSIIDIDKIGIPKKNYFKFFNSQKQIGNVLRDIFSIDEIRYWYGITLARLGVGSEALVIFQKIIDKVDNFHLLINRAEAFFHEGKYIKSYYCYREAALQVKKKDLLKSISLWLDASNPLRQQRKFLHQFYLLLKCWYSLWILQKIKKNKKVEQELASFYTYIAQHPFFIFKRWKQYFLEKAEPLRREKPMLSILTWVSIQAYLIQEGINRKENKEAEYPLVPIDFDDIAIHYKRIGNVVGEIDSYRKKGRKLINNYYKTHKNNYLELAKKTISRSLKLSKCYLHPPGCAKGTLLLAKIEYLKKNYNNASIYYREALKPLKELELCQLYKFIVVIYIHYMLLISRSKYIMGKWLASIFKNVQNSD